MASDPGGTVTARRGALPVVACRGKPVGTLRRNVSGLNTFKIMRGIRLTF
jgi:hypothetical protein